MKYYKYYLENIFFFLLLKFFLVTIRVLLDVLNWRET